MSSDNIKVSIITPTFNDERFIGDTIRSVLSQTHKNIELLVVDDCSSDNTVNIVKSFNDSRIKLVCNDKNCGAAYSRNVALKMATGDFVAFLDGDDIWNPDKIKKQLAFMLDNNYVFSCTYYNVINEDGSKTGVYYTTPKRIKRKSFMRTNYVGCLTVMYKRSIFENLQIPPSILKRNDYALWLKLSEKANCYSLPEILASYRKRKKSISSGKKTKLIKFHKKMFMELYGFNTFLSTIYAFRNIVFYGIRKILYKKKEKKNEN